MKTLRFALLAGLMTGCNVDQLFTGQGSGAPTGSPELAFSIQPRDVAAGVAITPAVQVRLMDAAGNPDNTFAGMVTIAIGTNPSGGVLKTTTTSAVPVNGIATFTDVKLDRAGSGYTLTATAAGAGTGTSNAFAVTPGAATVLSFTVQPSNAPSGATIQPPVQVTAYDAFSNQATNLSGTVRVALGQNPKSARLSGVASVTVANGVATFPNLSLDQSGSGVTLTASFGSGSPVVESVKFNITSVHHAPSQLAFVQQPATTQAGAAIVPPVGVAALDSLGNSVATDSTAVSIALGANPGGATLTGTRTVTTVNGFAFFTNLTLSRPGAGYTLTAASVGLTGATSAAFTVTAGPATTLAFLAQPHTTPAGSTIAPAVQVIATDSLGNTATSFAGSVTITLSANFGGAVLSGTKTVTAVNGVATFSDLKVDKAGTGYMLAATASGLAGALSSAFAVTPPATNLAFIAQPATTLAGAVIAPPVQVAARDSTGTTSGYSGPVTIAFGSNLSGALLGGTLTVNAVNGVATFANLTVSKAGTGYTLSATSTGLVSATSAAFDVTAPTATKLVFSVQPVATLAGTAIAPPVQIVAQDGTGNIVSSYSGVVTVALLANPGGGTLSGSLTATAVSGVATFSTLAVNKAGAGYTLTATATGLAGATSAAFTITAGAATKFAFSVQPQNTKAGSTIAPAVQITALDNSGNTATTYAGAVTIAIGTNPSGGTLSGTQTVNAVNGVATFSTLSVNRAGTGYTLSVTAPGLTGAVSAFFNIAP